MAENLKQKLIEDGYSTGAAEIVKIIDENNRKISRESLETKVSNNPRLDNGKTGKILEKLKKDGKISLKGKGEKIKYIPG